MGRRPAFALAALFAVLLQAFVVQTHIHTATPIGVAISQVSDRADDARIEVASLDQHQAVACVICQTLAGGASATLASSTTLVAEPIANAAATYALPRAPPIAAHPWQSRAPPEVLQA